MCIYIYNNNSINDIINIKKISFYSLGSTYMKNIGYLNTFIMGEVNEDTPYSINNHDLLNDILIDDLDIDLHDMEITKKHIMIVNILTMILLHYNCNSSGIHDFINDVMFMYHDNQFHNFEHAFCVTQFSHILMTKSSIFEEISLTDKISIIFACLLHDLHHPGKTNDFLQQTHDDIYLSYGRGFNTRKLSCLYGIKCINSKYFSNST